ncbi:MAG TPA: cytochrome o ubiquinol oxidase subunit IV [Candidatus Saccharimonadales bacterium]|nr:cytochrome o ubiquinol oxidase subunit IV [Candidatus Saccharimonadales bacterium]
MKEQKEPGTYLSYYIGFLLSVILTMAAYLVTKHHLNTHHTSPPDSVMPAILLGLGVIQLFIQLFFFLHLGREGKPRWKSMALVFAILVVLIIVVGSIWIMDNLNYRMTPSQVNTYLKNQDGGI